MNVHVPGPLRDYTAGLGLVEASGDTLGGLLADLDRRFPGMRFRMIDEQGRVREHIKLFVNSEQAFALDAALAGAREVHIICALSGG